MDYTDIYSEKFIASVREKLNSVGVVKTVKYLRVETGMSMIKAKKFVDTLKHKME